MFASGVFISAVITFFPTYFFNYFEVSDGVFEKVFKSLSLSIHNAMRLFVLDGEFDAIRDVVIFVGADKWVSTCYSIYGAILFVLAPVMTAGVVLAFIKNAKAYFVYYLNNKKEIYYFTELNEKSLILATDVYRVHGDKVLILFLNVNFDGDYQDLLEGANSIKAVCFNGKEINELSLKRKIKNLTRKIYFISENQTKNVENALKLIEKCRNDSVLNSKNTEFYVFSVKKEATILLDNADNSDIKVRRVNESRNLIYELLRNQSIFENAVDDNGVKKIHAVILGVGRHGVELLKALTWYSQMVGFEITIDVVDKSAGVENLIAGSCPELIKYNGKRIDGDAFYNIRFFENMDVNGYSFREMLTKSAGVTVAYAMLGDDDLNVSAAITMREEFNRLIINGENLGVDNPKIFALVESPEKNATISLNGGLKNYAGLSYDINLIGDINSQYSLTVIEQKELEEKGLKCHLRWSQTGEDVINDTKKFDNYEYFRNASIAEALYSEMRVKLGLLFNDLTGDEEDLKEYEHRRWNAYMRSEGYCFGKEKNSVAKTHPSLIPYKRLSESEKRKDQVVLQASEE